MRKRTEVVTRIKKAAQANGVAFVFRDCGGFHGILTLDDVKIPVCRHRDFTDRYAEDLYADCEAKLGRDWWR